MKWSVPVFKVFGIQVQLHGTFLLLLGFLGLGLIMLPDTNFAIFMLLQILSVFAIILLHELSHSLVAIGFGSTVRTITLLPIGGVAQIENIPEKPYQEILVAVAGPAVNFAFVLIIGIYLGHFNVFLENAFQMFNTSATQEIPEFTLTTFLVFLGTFNLFIGIFNLIPGFPMDGGRVLRGFLASLLPYDKATIVAVGIGQIVAFGFGILGIMFVLEYGQIYMGVVIIIIAFFLSSSGRAEARSVIIKTLLRGVKLETRMLEKAPVITTDMSNEHVLMLLNSSPRNFFPVLENGYYIGGFTRDKFYVNMQLNGQNAMLPVARTPWVVPGVDFIELLTVLERTNSQYIVVTDWYGRYLGVFNVSFASYVIKERVSMRNKLSLIEHKYLYGK